MRIINGRWQDQSGNSINNFNVSELLEIGQKVTAIYGENITYNRINLISSIKGLSSKQEDSLANLLAQEGLLDKLSGY